MNKKESQKIKEEYQKNFLYFKLLDYNKNEREYQRIRGIEEFLKGIGINFIPWQNEVIFNRNKCYITEWQEFCEFAKMKELTCNNDNIDIITDEIQFTSESEKMHNARLERINMFTNRLKNHDIKLPQE